MGKFLLTDELNDMYTTQVTNARKAKVETGASNFFIVSSAMTTAAKEISNTACWFKKIILGQIPATATVLHIYDTSSSGNFGGSSLTTGLGTSGTNKIALLTIDTSAGVCAASSMMPRVIPFDVYCSSGLCIQVGELGASGVAGCLKNMTIVYQA
jgi:hypothetical protein